MLTFKSWVSLLHIRYGKGKQRLHTIFVSSPCKQLGAHTIVLLLSAPKSFRPRTYNGQGTHFAWLLPLEKDETQTAAL